MKKTILFSARDAAAAYKINILFNYFYKKNYFVKIVAMEPAFGILESIIKKNKQKHLKKIKILKKKELIQKSFNILKRIKPNFIITGLSGPGAGIDEGLIYCGKKIYIPTFSYQDFYGDLNRSFKMDPDYFLVTDRNAAKYINNNTKSKSIVIGHMFNTTDYKKIISRYKKKNQQKSILICGQPLSKLNAYYETFKYLSNYLDSNKTKYKLYFRPHPKENEKSIKKIKKIFLNNKIVILRSTNPLIDLMNKTIIITCYSSLIMDFAKINSTAKKPLGVCVCMMFEKSIKEYYKKYTKLNFLPYKKTKIASEIKYKKEFNNVMKKVTKNAELLLQWKNSKKIFKKDLNNLDLFNRKLIIKGHNT